MEFWCFASHYKLLFSFSEKNVHDSYQHRSSKGKLTWIEYNGTQVADSEFSIKFINQTFGVDPDKHLTEEQKAMAYAMQVMVEEHTYW